MEVIADSYLFSESMSGAALDIIASMPEHPNSNIPHIDLSHLHDDEEETELNLSSRNGGSN